MYVRGGVGKELYKKGENYYKNCVFFFIIFIHSHLTPSPSLSLLTISTSLSLQQKKGFEAKFRRNLRTGDDLLLQRLSIFFSKKNWRCKFVEFQQNPNLTFPKPVFFTSFDSNSNVYKLLKQSQTFFPFLTFISV